jgi:hypothetical protein
LNISLRIASPFCFGRERIRLRVSENRTQGIMFGLKRNEGRRLEKLYYEGLHSLYSSPNIIRIIKSRRMRWARHATHGGD